MSLHDYLQMLRRRWRWVAAATLTGVVVALTGSLLATPTYQSTSSLFFSLRFGSSADDLAAGATFAQGQVDSFALLAGTPAVLEPVIEELDLDTTARVLARQVSTEVVPETVVVEVSVSDPSPRRAAEIANAVTDQLIATVGDLAPPGDDGAPTVEATVIAPATPPTQPATPRTALNVAVGLIAGLIIGTLAALARDLTDTRVRTAEDLARVTDLPLLAGLDTPPGTGDRRDLVVVTAPRSAQAEAFRALRTSVQFLARPGQALTLLVTSARPAEGKSTVAANLALTLAESGQRVALVDADLRRPSMADTFDLEGRAGLTSVLIGQAELDDVLQEWGGSGLRVLTSGPLPPNPSELLASPAMAELLDGLGATHDVVVVDTAPLLPVTDAVVLSRITAATLVVGDASRTRRPVLGQALALLERAGARLAGVVLTHVPHRRNDVYGYESLDPAEAGGPAAPGSGAAVVRQPRRPAVPSSR
ncbi:polysaccharide biosynthesis tyrosine autokinase [Blastococcus sp. SYSU DS0539]